jgi:hypothetical protein
MDLRDAIPTAIVTAAIGAGAAIFSGKSKKILTYSLAGAGAGFFANLVLGVELGKPVHHLTGIAVPSYRPAARRLGASSFGYRGAAGY